MKNEKYGFYFEKQLLSRPQGAISPAEQFFVGSLVESLVRETAQNSIDARAGEAPVRMVFELQHMQVESIPGITKLREHIRGSAESTSGSQGHDFIVKALEVSCKASVPVLRISDFGTKGLAGSEKRSDPTSPLSALTRGAGISSNDGTRGGSFGIGSAVGPLSSEMSTVFYRSLTSPTDSVVLAGYSRLASHYDSEGVERGGDGFYTDLSITKDFSYQRNPNPLTPFEDRTSPGTDVFILGYKESEADFELKGLRRAFLENFLVAIDRGTLVIEGKTLNGDWTLDSTTLPRYVKESSSAQAFYDALRDPTPIIEKHKKLGELRLYINIDDTLDTKLHTVTMRKPLMKIDTFKHNSISTKYAAILECVDPDTNSLLRDLEPPQHDRWMTSRASYGPSLLKALKDFVREGLRSRISAQVGETFEISGLAKYLPSDALTVGEFSKLGLSRPTIGRGDSRESSSVQGADDEFSTPTSPKKRPVVPVKVRESASHSGVEPAHQGKENGGAKGRMSAGGNLPGAGTPGQGGSQIQSGAIRFRSWSDARSKNLHVALTALEDISGDLLLDALGPEGVPEDSYQLPIASVSLLDGNSKTPVTHSGNMLQGLNLKSGETIRLEIELTRSGRYRLGVI